MITKLIKTLFCLCLLLLAAAQPLSASGKTMKIKVTFVRAELVSNNHVGNEWWWGGYINGKEVQEGQSVVLNVKNPDLIQLRAEAQEQDKYPDDGQTRASVKASSITKAITKTLNVTVVEDRGRYSGNQAKWRFTFKFQKV